MQFEADVVCAPIAAGGWHRSDWFPVLWVARRSDAGCQVKICMRRLTDKGDSLHFSAASLREFGIRYAQAFESESLC